MRWALLILFAACYREPEPTLTNKVTDAPSVLEIKATSVGPIDRGTKVTLTDLRALLVGYEVRPSNEGSLQYDVYRGSEKLLYVVPDDNAGVFNVHAVSAKVSVEGHPWRASTTFGDGARLQACECWGANPTCYRLGEHVAVNFNRACEDLEGNDLSPRRFRVLDGLAVQRVIWSPTAFGEDATDEGDDGL